MQEQLVDSVSASATVKDDQQFSQEDNKLQQIRQPYYHQVLQKRIQTLDADREVLRQLNKALTEENQNLKMKAPQIDTSYQQQSNSSMYIYS